MQVMKSYRPRSPRKALPPSGPPDALDLRYDAADGQSLARLAARAGNTDDEQAEVERLARIEDLPRFYVVLPSGGFDIGDRFTADDKTVWDMTGHAVEAYPGEVVECVRIWEPSDAPETYRFEVCDILRPGPIQNAVRVDLGLGDYGGPTGGDADVNETPAPRHTADGCGYNLLTDRPAKATGEALGAFAPLGYPEARELADRLHKASQALRDATWRIDSAFRSLREAKSANSPAAIAEAEAKITAATGAGRVALDMVGLAALEN